MSCAANDLAEPLLKHPDEQDKEASSQTQADGNVADSTGNSNTNMSRTTITCSLALAVSVAILPTFLFGYNTGCLNALEPVVFPGHTTAQWAGAVSSFCLGGIIGARYAGPISDEKGRRWALLGVGWLYIATGIMHVMAGNMAVLIVARALVGVAGGASTVLTPMYLGEISPITLRGSIGTMTQVSIVFGILASILLALPYATQTQWRYIFLPIPAIGLTQIFTGAFFLPESPRWLRLMGREEAARATIDRFSGRSSSIRLGVDGSEAEDGSGVEMIPGDSSTSLERFADDEDQPEVSYSEEQSPSIQQPPKPFCDFFCDRRNRIPIISSLLFPIAQQLSGINAVFYYSNMFFEGVIDDPMMGTVAAFAVNVVATLFVLPIMDRFGRKTLLCWSAGGMFMCCILLTFALLKVIPNNMAVVSVLLYITFFEVGLGCIPFFLVSELIEPEYFGRMQSLAMSSNWLCNFLVGMSFPFMVKHLGSFPFIPFAAALLFAFVYAIVWLPETRGKSLDEVMANIERRQTGRRQAVPVALAPNEDADFV